MKGYGLTVEWYIYVLMTMYLVGEDIKLLHNVQFYNLMLINLP